MKMTVIMEMDEMEITITIIGMEIKIGEMMVQGEMHQSLRLVPIMTFSIVNHATLVVLKESPLALMRHMRCHGRFDEADD
ncbi:hypothetical protein Tco_1359338 [Tanacetum coccineum]